jgi:hypothetical protein
VLAVCLAAYLLPPATTLAAEAGATVSSLTVTGEKPPVAVVWKQWPAPGRAMLLTPERAQRFGVGGWALVDCLVAADGKLTDCNAWAVSAKDWGFDAAADRLLTTTAPQMDLSAPGAYQLVDKPVRFAVVFRVDYPEFRRSQSNKPQPLPPVCFPKDDGSVPIISTPQSADPAAAIRRC